MNKEMTNTITVKIPGGYKDEAGGLHREVELRGLTGREEELLVQSNGQDSDQVITVLLTRCMQRLGEIRPVPVEIVSGLNTVDRHYLVLKLREMTFGEKVQATVSCTGAACGEKVDIDFSLQDLARELSPGPVVLPLEMEIVCAECGKEFSYPFDLYGFFLDEVRKGIEFLYREVHLLAYHYHWSEQEILAMSRQKRRMYIEILADEIERMNESGASFLPPGGFGYPGLPPMSGMAPDHEGNHELQSPNYKQIPGSESQEPHKDRTVINREEQEPQAPPRGSRAESLKPQVESDTHGASSLKPQEESDKPRTAREKPKDKSRELRDNMYPVVETIIPGGSSFPHPSSPSAHSSHKTEAASHKTEAENDAHRAASHKPQDGSRKRRASSSEPQAASRKLQEENDKHRAVSHKPQAKSRELSDEESDTHRAVSQKPQAKSRELSDEESDTHRTASHKPQAKSKDRKEKDDGQSYSIEPTPRTVDNRDQEIPGQAAVHDPQPASHSQHPTAHIPHPAASFKQQNAKENLEEINRELSAAVSIKPGEHGSPHHSPRGAHHPDSAVPLSGKNPVFSQKLSKREEGDSPILMGSGAAPASVPLSGENPVFSQKPSKHKEGDLPILMG
ncbi:MAG: hypothetical protein KAW12_08185, partial [Candidatus Aminicenantes bacterium]|nr:hypothetical protein [Candidatus Aminicenantes bacterium]